MKNNILFLTGVCLALGLAFLGCKKTEADDARKSTDDKTVSKDSSSTSKKDSTEQTQDERRFHFDYVQIDSASEYVMFPVSIVVSKGEGQRKSRMESLREGYSSRDSKSYASAYQNILFYHTKTQRMEVLDTTNSMVFTDINPEKKLNVVFYNVVSVDNNKDGKLEVGTDAKQLYASDKKGENFTPIHPLAEAFQAIQVIREPNVFRVSTIKDLNNDGKFEGWDEMKYYQVTVSDSIPKVIPLEMNSNVLRILQK